MTRLLLALLCALGLAFSPMAATASSLPGNAMLDCTMGKDMPDMPADHSKMDCCTPVCHAPSAAAVLPQPDLGPAKDIADKVALTWTPSKELLSAVSSGLDPPPRS
jgi:hypothetical protein